MSVEELDDIAEELADKLGIYSVERSFWTSEFKQRVRKAIEVERKIKCTCNQSFVPCAIHGQ